MIAHKHISKIVAVIMAIAVCLCLCAMAFTDQLVAALGGTSVTMEYESKLFDTGEPLNVNIIMDDAEWTDMIANAISEQYYQCDVEINGVMYYRVGIRPKGNTSLSNIVSDPDTDRFSFKLEFDRYVDGQTCYGLDKLILNNNYADATNMKEALIYDMFQYLGADASLTNYATISVNDEYWGIYLALEAVEDSFLLRNYGTTDGELYKPDSMEMGAGKMTPTNMGNSKSQKSNMSEKPDMSQMPNKGEFDMSQIPNMEEFDMSQIPNKGEFDMSQMPNMDDIDIGGFFGKGMGGNGANLNYTDDNLDSYSTIWEGEITKTSTKDHKRVVEALKNISQGTKLEEYMDIDNLLKYMAVHVFSVNEDSLSGSMAHNYYLYESNGMLNVLPWDYNLMLGGMGGMGGMNRSSGIDSATSIVNDPIDNAFASTEFFDTLMENEEYKAKYYSYLQQLVDEYLLGDGFENFYTKTLNQIDSLVETDPTAFYTYEQYTTAVETLYELVKLRGQSILGQLNGTIPSTQSEQKNADTLIDASNLDVSSMGSMNMGGGQGNFSRGERGDTGNSTQEETSTVLNLTTSSEDTGNAGESQQFNGQMPEGMTPPQFGEMPEGMTPPQFGEMPEGMTPPQFGEMPEGMTPPQVDGEMPEGMTPPQFNGEMPEGMTPPQFDGEMPEGMTPPQVDGEMPEGMTPPQTGSQMPEGFDQSQSNENITSDEQSSAGQSSNDTTQSNGSAGQSGDNTTQSNGSGGQSGDNTTQSNGSGGQTGNNTTQSDKFGGQMKNNFDWSNMFNMDPNSNSVASTQTIIIYGICFAVLIVALIFAKLYKRKPRKR